MTEKTFKTYPLLLLPVMLVCGWLSVYFGKELCWDLANYHYYGPFALLNNRGALDYWPNTYIHQFINPAIDLLTYFLINEFSPAVAEFILGALHGVNLWLLFLIARFMIHEKHATVIAALITVMGLLGPTVLPGMGSFQNDNLAAIFVLGFVLLQLRSMKHYQQTGYLSYTGHALSGMILGLGFGLKLTLGIYITGGIAGILVFPAPLYTRVKTLCVVGTGCAVGMLATSGYWMTQLWITHHNPFFPFFNNIFHSPDFIDAAWRDRRFLPATWAQTLFYPFYFAWDGRTADAAFRDLRFPIVYLLFVLATLHWIRNRLGWRHVSRAVPGCGTSPAGYHNDSDARDFSWLRAWLYVFFICSYIVWQSFFSIARYLAPLEMLAPLLIYLLIQQMIRSKAQVYTACFLVFYIMLYFFAPIPMIRAPWYNTSFFNIQLPAYATRTPKATVLMTYTAYVMDRDPRPQTYLIPFFPRGWRFLGIPFWHEQYLPNTVVEKSIRTRLHGDKNPTFLLTPAPQMPALYEVARHFDLMPAGPCEKIRSDRQAVTHQDVLLCPVVAMNASGRQV